MSEIIPTCPTGCDFTLADISFSDCAPAISWGEVEYVVLGDGDSAPFADWEDDSEWATRVAETGDNKLRKLTVIADLPIGSADEVIISKGRKVKAPASRILNIEIDDTTDENYEFMRATACNSQMRMWFFTRSHQYGGNDGILAMINLDPVIEKGTKTINKFVGTAKWDAQFAPERAKICWTSTTFIP